MSLKIRLTDLHARLAVADYPGGRPAAHTQAERYLQLAQAAMLAGDIPGSLRQRRRSEGEGALAEIGLEMETSTPVTEIAERALAAAEMMLAVADRDHAAVARAVVRREVRTNALRWSSGDRATEDKVGVGVDMRSFGFGIDSNEQAASRMSHWLGENHRWFYDNKIVSIDSTGFHVEVVVADREAADMLLDLVDLWQLAVVAERIAEDAA